jgi:sortase (surface protein transpeptidase)
MQIPPDPRMVGLWSGGARPGNGRGHVVVVGHINYAGVGGALSVLPGTRPGDRVTIVENDKRFDYSIVAIRTYAKARGLPASLFSGSGPEQLILVTCGGPLDAGTGSYLDNIVAYATPISR